MLNISLFLWQSPAAGKAFCERRQNCPEITGWYLKCIWRVLTIWTSNNNRQCFGASIRVVPPQWLMAPEYHPRTPWECWYQWDWDFKNSTGYWSGRIGRRPPCMDPHSQLSPVHPPWASCSLRQPHPTAAPTHVGSDCYTSRQEPHGEWKLLYRGSCNWKRVLKNLVQEKLFFFHFSNFQWLLEIQGKVFFT